jgi:hypothetical protein
MSPGDPMRLVLSLALLGLLTITPAMAGQKDYNGRWAIFATTERGQCVKGFRLAIRIHQGKAYIVGRSVNGTKAAVNARGHVNIKYVSGDDVITVNGILKGRSGGGKWSYPTYRCTGRWRAERR